jgi:hypothetical protein
MIQKVLQTSDAPSNTMGKLKMPSSILCLVMGVSSLGLVMAFPSGIAGWFDGLPWAGKMETLTLSVIIPFLLILGWRFLALRFSIIFLGVLFFLKAILFIGSPASGWLVKIHPNLSSEDTGKYHSFQTVEGEGWVRTFASTWNSEASGILSTSWAEKRDFPLDWLLMKIGKCGISGIKCFDSISPTLEIDGALIIPDGKKFVLLAEGVQSGNLVVTNESGESLIISPAKDMGGTALEQYRLPGNGRWRVSGKLIYAGTEWSLIPALIEPNGDINRDLGRDVLWQNYDEVSQSLEYIGFFKTVSFIIDASIICFFLAWSAWTVRALIHRQILILPIAIVSISAVFMPIVFAPVFSRILNLLNSPDLTTISNLGFSILAVGVGFLIFIIWSKAYQSFKVDHIIPSIFILFGPALLFFFARLWWPSLGKWENWGSGDDWTTYQLFARRIFVEGEWLNAGEGVFMLQPFYRYFVGVYHWLFGQSAFVQHMADVWCVLGGTLLIASFAVKFRVSSPIIFSVSFIYLAINLISAFRYHIGRGLVENHAMVLMMLAAWYLYRAQEGGAYKIILATFFGISGYWMRQDHLGAIAGLVFLVLEPVEESTGTWKAYWDRFTLHWRVFAWYWGAGILSVLLVCLRNWWVGDVFNVTHMGHPNLGGTSASPFPGSFYIVLTGNVWPTFPSMSGFIVTFGALIALFALVCQKKAFDNFPRSFGIIIIGLLLPYVFVWNWAYPPRFSIHLLPLALLSWAILLDNVYQGFKLRVKNQ